MPFHIADDQTKIVFITSAETPALIYQASLATGLSSNTAWLQRAVARQLAADLDISYADLESRLPRNRSDGRHELWRERAAGPGNTDESVR